MSDSLDIFVRDMLAGRYLAFRDRGAVGIAVLPPEPAGWVVHQFTYPNKDPFVCYGVNLARILVVGGGGAGGGGAFGGGGGGGGVRFRHNAFIRGSYDISVGAGGAGINYGGKGGNGGGSCFGSNYNMWGVLGGGGGAAYWYDGSGYYGGELNYGGCSAGSSGGGAATTGNEPLPGLPDGGAGYWDSEDDPPPASGDPRGFEGGDAQPGETWYNPAGGGGGGAGGPGISGIPSSPGNGGDGFHCDILFGPDAPDPGAKYWGGGGGGMCWPNSYYYGGGGEGGLGGGGTHGVTVWADPTGHDCDGDLKKLGTDGLGGGGAGGGMFDAYHGGDPNYSIGQAAGGDGGSGTVIIRYHRRRGFSATGGAISYYTESGALIP